MGWWSGEWCCQHFRRAFESRADRGQFVFASPPVPRVSRTHSFWLAFRIVDRAEFGRLGVGCLAPPDVKVYLSCVQAIFFCPWCGRRLARYYGALAAGLVDPAVCAEFQVPGWG